MTEPRELPMIFQGWGVRAILDGLKTNTRRIIKPQPLDDGRPINIFVPGGIMMDGTKYQNYACPYPKGTRIWVKETWRIFDAYSECGCSEDCSCVRYHGRVLYYADIKCDESKWKPSIFMKREHSRIDLIVTKDRPPERVQDITEEDAIAEGAKFVDFGKNQYSQQRPGWRHDYTPVKWEDSYSSAKWSFAAIWNKINAKPKPKKRKGVITHYESYPWSEESMDPRKTINGKPHLCWPNPYVWPVEFERIKP
jgi:hypothetical protein